MAGAGYSASSSATSGVTAKTSFNNSKTINFGTQQTIPTAGWLAIAALAAWFLFKRGR